MTQHTHLCKYLFSHDIPVFQQDHFSIKCDSTNFCFNETILSPMFSKMTGSTIDRTLMGLSSAHSVLLDSESPSSVKKLEIVPLEEKSNIPVDTAQNMNNITPMQIEVWT